MFIYAIVCNESLKLYVGQHKGDDLGKYLSRKFWDANHHTSGTRSHLYAAMRKHPRETWSIRPLLEVDTKDQLDFWEKHFIRTLKAQDPNIGYNICDGGEGFTGPHSEATKRKISEEHKQSSSRWHAVGNKQSSETIAKRSAGNTGQTRTQEQRDNISAGSKGKGIGNRCAAGKRTGQALENVLEANKRIWTPERRKQRAERIAAYNLSSTAVNRSTTKGETP